MVRSYALTFGAVTFRLWLLVLTGAGVPGFVAYQQWRGSRGSPT